MSEIKCIFIGKKFYEESGWAMSSIYTEQGQRMDFGAIQIHLENGGSVTIRQATDEELGRYTRILHKL